MVWALEYDLLCFFGLENSQPFHCRFRASILAQTHTSLTNNQSFLQTNFLSHLSRLSYKNKSDNSVQENTTKTVKLVTFISQPHLYETCKFAWYYTWPFLRTFRVMLLLYVHPPYVGRPKKSSFISRNTFAHSIFIVSPQVWAIMFFRTGRVT